MLSLWHCVNHWSEWLLSMAPGFVVGETKDLIWFDFSPTERCTERIFLRPQLPCFTFRENTPPTNKPIDHCKWSLCECVCECMWNAGLYMFVCLFVSVFLTLCEPHLCVCRLETDLSSSWQMPSTAQLGPSHRRGHGDPRFPLGPLRLF